MSLRDNPSYKLWDAMKQRCLNPNNKNYHNYGARGIEVCEKWMEFKGFLEDMGNPGIGLTLDRIDNDKGYSKENCRWITQKENCNNTRKNHRLTFDGKTHTLSEWEDITGIKANTILTRVRRGWTNGEALEFEKHLSEKEKARLLRVRSCELCGSEFTPRPYQLKMGQGKLCSIKCSSKKARIAHWGEPS